MRGRTRSVRVLLLAAALVAAPLAAQESVNYSYTWWNAAEPGWGYNLSHQGDLLYGTWYSYADDGKPMFLTVEARLNADGSFSGPVYRVAGTPFAQINGSQAFTAVTEVGTAQMRFNEAGELELSYTISGTTQTRTLTRFTFADNPPVCVGTTASRAAADNYSDLWWNPTEAGWGLTLSHQGDVIFVLWYTYGEGGRDQWVSGATLVRQPDGSYSGALQRPNSGTPLLQIAGAATSFPVPAVGSATLVFSDGENGEFSYTLDGVTQTKSIQRFVAVAADQPKPLCRVEDGGGGGGNPDACFPDQHVLGQVRRVRVSSAGSSEVLVHEVKGPATFQGQAATLIEIRQQNGDYTNDYRRIEDGAEVIVGQEVFANGALTATLTYSPLPRTPHAPPLGQTLSQSYVVTTTGVGPVQTTETIRLVRRESVTVPAGTFDNACYLERQITSSISGFTAVTEQKIWARADVAEVIRAEQTARIAGTVTEQSVQELLSVED